MNFGRRPGSQQDHRTEDDMALRSTSKHSRSGPARPPSPQPPARSRKTVTVPRTSRQKRKGDKPPFRTDMDFIDET